jgi:CheY-like chemotaxis protein
MQNEAGTGATILIADDEEIVRDVCRLALERSGYEILLSTDGPETVRVFRDRAADIRGVLLDLTMPGMQGEQVLKELRAIRADVPVLITSGYPSNLATHAPGTGRTSFLPKPFRPQQLVEAMEQLLA